MMIEILDVRLLNSDKPLRAFVDVKLNDITIREFRIIKENGRRPWVATPQISWRDTDGRIKYKTVVTFPDELKGQIDFAILKRFNEEMEKKQDAKQ